LSTKTTELAASKSELETKVKAMMELQADNKRKATQMKQLETQIKQQDSQIKQFETQKAQDQQEREQDNQEREKESQALQSGRVGLPFVRSSFYFFGPLLHVIHYDSIELGYIPYIFSNVFFA